MSSWNNNTPSSSSPDAAGVPFDSTGLTGPAAGTTNVQDAVAALDGAGGGGGGGTVTAWDHPVDDGSWLLEGTASIAGGLIALSATAGSSDGGRAAASRAPSAATPSGLELVADPMAFDAVIRLDSLTGNASCYAGLYVRFRTGDEIRFWYDAGGSVQCGYLGSAWNLITAYAAGLVFNGTQWLKLSVRSSTIVFFYGNGTATEPPVETGWTRLATYDASSNHVAAFRLYREVGAVATSYGGAPITATFDRLRVRNAGMSTRTW